MNNSTLSGSGPAPRPQSKGWGWEGDTAGVQSRGSAGNRTADSGPARATAAGASGLGLRILTSPRRSLLPCSDLLAPAGPSAPWISKRTPKGARDSVDPWPIPDRTGLRGELSQPATRQPSRQAQGKAECGLQKTTEASRPRLEEIRTGLKPPG